jgi:hypothetical protein
MTVKKFFMYNLTQSYRHLILLADEQASESVADVVLRGKNDIG